MSDLRPIGRAVMLDGAERHFLFTLNVVDEVQDHYDCSLEEVINKLTDKKESIKALRYLTMALLNDEAERSPQAELKTYTEQEAGWLITQENVLDVTMAVLQAYGLSLPEPDEFASPNGEGGRSE